MVRVKETSARFEVQAILAHRREDNGFFKFEIHWKGYDKDESTWQSEADLANARQILNAYKVKHPDDFPCFTSMRGRSICSGKASAKNFTSLDYTPHPCAKKSVCINSPRPKRRCQKPKNSTDYVSGSSLEESLSTDIAHGSSSEEEDFTNDQKKSIKRMHPTPFMNKLVHSAEFVSVSSSEDEDTGLDKRRKKSSKRCFKKSFESKKSATQVQNLVEPQSPLPTRHRHELSYVAGYGSGSSSEDEDSEKTLKRSLDAEKIQNEKRREKNRRDAERKRKQRSEQKAVQLMLIEQTMMNEAEPKKKCYLNLNAFFLYFFKQPEGRTDLRPDIGNPTVKDCLDWAYKHLVRSNSYMDGGFEMWQLGDEDPMECNVFKNIITHSCSGIPSDLYNEGTMLLMWRSVLLHCPECTTLSSLEKAEEKVTLFVEDECKKRYH